MLTDTVVATMLAKKFATVKVANVKKTKLEASTPSSSFLNLKGVVSFSTPNTPETVGLPLMYKKNLTVA